MSHALTTNNPPSADSSLQSAGTHPDISLGSLSLASGLSTPAKPLRPNHNPNAKSNANANANTALRIPSASSQTTAQSSQPVLTPSPPPHSHTHGAVFSRQKPGPGPSAAAFSLSRKLSEGLNTTDTDEDLDTPAVEKNPNLSRYMDDEHEPEHEATTPVVSRARRKTGAAKGGATLTLRDQEKHIDSLKKENFDIKLKVHFLEERLAQLAPDQMDAALKQNINLKIEVQSHRMEIKKLKKLLLEAQKELERAQAQASNRGGAGRRERELEERLEEREREIRELRKRRVSAGGGGGGVDETVLREVEARNAELEDELDNARGLLEENMEEIERLREIVERTRGDDSSSVDDVGSNGGSRRGSNLKQRVEELEDENEVLRTRLDEQTELVALKEDEKSDLADEIDGLHLTIEDLHRKLHIDSMERSESRAQMLSSQEEKEAVEIELAGLQDKLAAARIEVQQREDEVEAKEGEIERLIREHDRIVGVVEDEWRGEVEEARGQVEELRDVLDERDKESKELRLHIAELEADTNALHDKFEAALAHLETQSEEKDAEIENLNKTIENLSSQLYVLEDEMDRLREEHERQRDEDAAERERLEALVAALKDKLSTIKSELEETTTLYETCTSEIHLHRARQEELATHIENLVAELTNERTTRAQLESTLASLEKDHDASIRRERRTLEAKESALQSALNDLARAESLLAQRETDLNAVQSALQGLEAERKKAGELNTSARFSMQLEVDRLRRDIERLESDLTRARSELAERDTKFRDRDSVLDKLYAENRDLASEVAVQTQARLNLSEKLDSAQVSLRGAEGEVGVLRVRVGELEERLSKDQRSLLSAENQYRDQLTERNTLLLTIYQYLDKILGVDKTPKKGTSAETKPFTNFSIFHSNLITRLKQLSLIQSDFEKRTKEIEARFSDRLNEMRKQIENRWKQIDRFESSVKVYADAKALWRKKLSTKEGEVEALKVTNAEMAAQLAGLKSGKSAGTDAMELRSLSTRAVNAERRLNNAQNQLLATEEKIAAMNQRNAAADAKWEARVKEYESRLKIAEEKVKRERQGGKERAGELEGSVKSLQRQLEVAQKRNTQLSEMLEQAGGKGVGASP